MRRVFDWRGHAFLAFAARVYLGGVFLLACYHKILDPAGFALDVAAYDILPLSLINLTALVLPSVELLAGLLLVLGFRTRAAALAVLGMMTVFIVALSIALARGQEMSCGCFASSGEADAISAMTLVRDGFWFLLAVYILVLDRSPIGLDRLIRRARADR